MIFDELSVFTRICIAVITPPVLTVLCWVFGPRLAGRLFARTFQRSWKEFWALLLAAYLIFGLAIAGSKLLSGNENEDPSTVLSQ